MEVCMNIMYCADDNYSRHAGISMMSLFEKNKNTDKIDVYIVSVNISADNKRKIKEIADTYKRKVFFIDFEEFKDRLVLDNGDNEHPISAYARIFVDELLPKSVDKVLYLDCDILINDSLDELWQNDMQGKALGAVQDICYMVFRNETGIEQPYRYFCSGVLLIDMRQWRKENCQKKLTDYVDERKGVLQHHDQTILNGVFGTDYYVLHPKYDVLTPVFLMSYKNLVTYYGCEEDFYTKKEIKESVKNPAIIHYTSSGIGRPWENNNHPLAHLYQDIKNRSPWYDYPKQEFKQMLSKDQLRVYKMYQKLPVGIISILSKIKELVR